MRFASFFSACVAAVGSKVYAAGIATPCRRACTAATMRAGSGPSCPAAAACAAAASTSARKPRSVRVISRRSSAAVKVTRWARGSSSGAASVCCASAAVWPPSGTPATVTPFMMRLSRGSSAQAPPASAPASTAAVRPMPIQKRRAPLRADVFPVAVTAVTLASIRASFPAAPGSAYYASNIDCRVLEPVNIMLPNCEQREKRARAARAGGRSDRSRHVLLVSGFWFLVNKHHFWNQHSLEGCESPAGR